MNIELTKNQIEVLLAALHVSIEESKFRFERITKNDAFLYDKEAIERIKLSMERENEARNQILELLKTIN